MLKNPNILNLNKLFSPFFSILIKLLKHYVFILALFIFVCLFSVCLVHDSFTVIAKTWVDFVQKKTPSKAMNTQRNIQRERGKAGLSALRGLRAVQKVNQHHILFFTCIIEDEKVCCFILNFLFSGKKIEAARDFPAAVVVLQVECNENEENWKDKDSEEQQSRWKKQTRSGVKGTPSLTNCVIYIGKDKGKFKT